MRGSKAKKLRKMAHYTMNDRGLTHETHRRYHIIGAHMVCSGARHAYRSLKRWIKRGKN